MMLTAQTVNRFLKSKTITMTIIVLLIIVATIFITSLTHATKIESKQIATKEAIAKGFKRLDPCVTTLSTPHLECLHRLSIVSKALDESKAPNPKEAIAWGAAQSLMRSRIAEQYPDVHEDIVTWAVIEKYVPRHPESIEQFRNDLVNTYSKYRGDGK